LIVEIIELSLARDTFSLLVPETCKTIIETAYAEEVNSCKPIWTDSQALSTAKENERHSTNTTI